MHETTDIRAIVIGDEVVSAMERTTSQGDFRANLSKGGNGYSITLSESETAMCVKAARAVGLEFAGVDLIRERMGQTYVTEVNGNPGTGVIDFTGQNYSTDLVAYIETRTKKGETITAIVPSPNENGEHIQNEEEATLDAYGKLLVKEKAGLLSYNENALFSFLRKKMNKV